MPTGAPFHLVTEPGEPGLKRMHHTNDGCTEGRTIALSDRIQGTGWFRRRVECSRLGEIDALKAVPPAATAVR